MGLISCDYIGQVKRKGAVKAVANGKSKKEEESDDSDDDSDDDEEVGGLVFALADQIKLFIVVCSWFWESSLAISTDKMWSR